MAAYVTAALMAAETEAMVVMAGLEAGHRTSWQPLFALGHAQVALPERQLRHFETDLATTTIRSSIP